MRDLFRCALELAIMDGEEAAPRQVLPGWQSVDRRIAGIHRNPYASRNTAGSQ